MQQAGVPGSAQEASGDDRSGARLQLHMHSAKDQLTTASCKSHRYLMHQRLAADAEGLVPAPT